MDNFCDKSTHDASRVCFFSHDPDAYYNPLAVPIVIRDYIPLTEAENKINLVPDKNNFICNQEIGDKKAKTFPEKEEKSGHPDEQEYATILRKIGNRPIIRKRNLVNIPDEIKQLLPLIMDKFSEIGIEIEQQENIQYGIKLRFNHKENWAETNIFYGKKGFSVVLTPKSGSHPDLGEIGVNLIHNAIADFWLNSEIGTLEIEGGKEYLI